MIYEYLLNFWEWLCAVLDKYCASPLKEIELTPPKKLRKKMVETYFY